MRVIVYQEVIIEETPDMLIVKCGRCKGTGTKDRDGRDPKCKVCSGSGKVLVRIRPDTNSFIKCGFCRGDGTADRDGRDPNCPVCKGIGGVLTTLPAIICNRCNGTGSADKDGRTPICPVCRGIGVVPMGDLNVY